FQAEDGIRDRNVTGVQTCALPIYPPVEVILLSRNDPDTGLRVMNSIQHYALPITRAVFMQGRSPHPYIPAFDIELFLSANADDEIGRASCRERVLSWDGEGDIAEK